MGSTLSTNIKHLFKWSWYNLTKGLYRHELQLIIAPIVILLIQESFNSFYPKIPAYFKQSNLPENELKTLFEFTLFGIYYSTVLIQVLLLIGLILLPGYFCYNLRYRKQLKQQMTTKGDFWLKKLIMKVWKGKYKVFVKLFAIMIFFIILNIICMFLYPELPALLSENTSDIVDQMDDNQKIIYYLYMITYIGFLFSIIFIGYYVNKYWHPVIIESIQSDDFISKPTTDDLRIGDVFTEKTFDDTQNVEYDTETAIDENLDKENITETSFKEELDDI